MAKPIPTMESTWQKANEEMKKIEKIVEDMKKVTARIKK